ncbi:tRNA-uridine aminocarboxypropyltransferase [Cellvibrio sp. NN19]|uniref:tRNA-uridine aminocarboxypropyltransferase n=1 Tax=Cellvibrio chitinivorans TaxID=3102792 RepID=UPI002B41215D|nr:tRNA-uridine aminocarboxypropyltransferase [Cellvibrio sp. NN19]
MSSTTKRPTCSTCARPIRNCICALVKHITNRVDVLILQHPDESTNAKNTAGLLHLSLKSSQLHVGETFNAEDIQRWLFSNQKTPVLLYPDTPEHKSLGLIAPPPFEPLANTPFDQLRLVVIDATWRKSRKMLYLNPALQNLPRLALAHTPASLYKIRKAHSENQLSTLEASCYALQQLEQGAVDYQPLLDAMSHFVAQQSAFVPSHIPDQRNPDL